MLPVNRKTNSYGDDALFDIIIRYIQGFFKIKVTGINLNRFINLCKARDISIWSLNRDENELVFFVGYNDFQKLSEPATKTLTDIVVLKEFGLKFFIRKNKRRVPFVIGIIIFASLIYIQSLFVWKISVSGESDYTADEILKYINKNYVAPGTLKSQVDCEALEQNLREYFEDIAWISCSLEGTKLSVEITETLNVFTDTSMDTPCNIVASTDCTISDIVTAKGVPVVTSGTEVKKGDILISGAVYLYDDNNEVLDTNYVSAEGEVYGIFTYEYNSETSLTYYSKEYTENKKAYYSFGALKYMFTPYVPSITYENFDVITDTSFAHIGDSFFLPLSIEKSTVYEYELVQVTLTEDEAYKKAEARLFGYISDLQEKGVQIIENNVKIVVGDGVCVAEGSIVVCQLVGIPQKLTVVSEGEQTLE